MKTNFAESVQGGYDVGLSDSDHYCEKILGVDPRDLLEALMEELREEIWREVANDKKLKPEHRDQLFFGLGLLEGRVQRLQSCCRDYGLLYALQGAVREAFWLGGNCPDSRLKKIKTSPALEGNKRKREQRLGIVRELAPPFIKSNPRKKAHYLANKTGLLGEVNKRLSIKEKQIGPYTLRNDLKALFPELRT